ncbi:MAG: four-carbon acid sugar kinase family protein, partial [Paracoccaceae bacterium]
MEKPFLGVIADDYTGATDIASMLVRGGMRTIQTIGIPSQNLAKSLHADAVVIALKSRSIALDAAVAQSLEAAFLSEMLKSAG